MTSVAIAVISGYPDNQETEAAENILAGTFDRVWHYRNLCLMSRLFIQADLHRREMNLFSITDHCLPELQDT